MFSSVVYFYICNVGGLGSIPGLGRSPGEGKGHPLQYSGLENSMDGIVHRVTKGWTQLSDFHFTFLYMLLLLSRFSRVQLCATPQTAAHQAPPSLGFSRQEYEVGSLPNPGIELSSPTSPALVAGFFFTTSATWEVCLTKSRLKVKVKVAQSCLTLCNPMDCTVHGILQGRILEWVAFPFSRGSSQPRGRTQVSCIAGRFFTS